MSDVEISRVDNGYILKTGFPYASYSKGAMIFKTLDEVIAYLKEIFHS